MRSSDEMFEWIVERMEAHEQLQQQRKRIVKRVVPVFASFVFVVFGGFYLQTHIGKIPTAPEHSSFIETTGASESTGLVSENTPQLTTEQSSVSSQNRIPKETTATAFEKKVVSDKTTETAISTSQSLHSEWIQQPVSTISTQVSNTEKTVQTTISSGTANRQTGQGQIVDTISQNGGMTFPTQTQTVPTTETITEPTTDEMTKAPQWDEMTIDEQFLSFQQNGIEYVSRTTRIPTELVGSYLNDIVLTGQDYYTEEIHTANARVYQIEGISPECALAVRFQGYDNYLSYTSSDYLPETMGAFYDDLHLSETLSFGTVYHTDLARLDSYDDAVLRAVFTDYRNCKCITDDQYHKPLFSVSVSIELLGIHNKSMKFTEDGYMTTNLMEWGYSFYIGTERVQEIAAAVGVTNAVPADTSPSSEDIVPE